MPYRHKEWNDNKEDIAEVEEQAIPWDNLIDFYVTVENEECVAHKEGNDQDHEYSAYLDRPHHGLRLHLCLAIEHHDIDQQYNDQENEGNDCSES